MVPNPIKMDDLGVSLFLETPMSGMCGGFWVETHDLSWKWGKTWEL